VYFLEQPEVIDEAVPDLFYWWLCELF